MTKPALKTVTRLQGNNRALVTGEIEPQGFMLDFVDVPVLVQAFRRMVRALEFDVCEMALTTYVCAREHGIRFTALPVFLVRAFHHGAILVRSDSGIESPSELEGQSVGVNRGYTVTTGVWARAVLQDEHGVDLRKITWMLSGDEHVEAYRPPANVKQIPAGVSIESMLKNGKLAAAINIKSDDPDIRPLIPNATEAGLEAYRSRGHYPINHLLVVRDDVLERYPEVATCLFGAFAESKRIYLERLRLRAIEEPDAMDELYARLLSLGDDPLPYGIEPNRAALEELVRHAMSQGILTRPVEIESLFAPSTLSLEA
jgi:4,5-dihydroxyphthalate decarboxylase